ncbi:hypothetical protein F2Q70_00026829 [Brassica cretica]|uniref:Uncharacterized protein n=1 Tax=Brassica cretica TaxID=69181 RepID=A0A8S9LDP2_BRACR|nr:hypothetical protein F2Q70_00026829 [Brassica cretica]
MAKSHKRGGASNQPKEEIQDVGVCKATILCLLNHEVNKLKRKQRSEESRTVKTAEQKITGTKNDLHDSDPGSSSGYIVGPDVFHSTDESKKQGDFEEYGWANTGTFDDLIECSDGSLSGADELWSSSIDVSNSPSKPLPSILDSQDLSLGTEFEKQENQQFPFTEKANGPSSQSVPSVRVTPKSVKYHEHKGQISLEVSYMATCGFASQYSDVKNQLMHPSYNPATAATSVNMETWAQTANEGNACHSETTTSILFWIWKQGLVYVIPYLLRLADSSFQRHLTSDTSYSNKTIQVIPEEKSRHRYARMLDTETVTNPTERTVAHLLFHRPFDMSVAKHIEGPGVTLFFKNGN